MFPDDRIRRGWAERGIDIGKAEAAKNTHDGACACCGGTDPGKRGWMVDHDHVTGEIRGILCNRCNLGIGLLGDSIEGVRKALTYLEKHYGV
jgi:hypothetical protein